MKTMRVCKGTFTLHTLIVFTKIGHNKDNSCIV